MTDDNDDNANNDTDVNICYLIISGREQQLWLLNGTHFRFIDRLLNSEVVQYLLHTLVFLLYLRELELFLRKHLVKFLIEVDFDAINCFLLNVWGTKSKRLCLCSLFAKQAEHSV